MNRAPKAIGESWRGPNPVAESDIIRKIDPRVRVAAAFLFAIALVTLSDPVALAAALAVGMALLTVSGLPFGPTLRRVAAMDAFLVFVVAMLPFTMPGETIVTFFGYPGSFEGLIRAIDIALTANAVALTSTALVGGMEGATLGHALHRLKAPGRLVYLFLFTARYIDVLREEYLRLRGAMKVRGFRPKNNRHTYVSLGYVVGMTLVRALERSERILAAMKCRGFSGRMPIPWDDFQIRGIDYIFLFGVAVVVAGLVLLDIRHITPY